jgi:hypothetical protein
VRSRVKWRDLRAVLLFTGGFVGLAVETVAWLNGRTPDPQLLIVFSAMMGLELFLRGDEKG